VNLREVLTEPAQVPRVGVALAAIVAALLAYAIAWLAGA
jgi:phage-related minor tail protein